MQRTRTRLASSCVVAAALALLAWLGHRAPVAAQADTVGRLTCGDYEAVPSGKASDGRSTRVGIQKAGRLMQTVTDWSILRLDCADMDGDRTAELIVATDSGGAACCETLHVWALAATPKKLLEYSAGGAGGYERRDLDADGREELLVADDTFAYFGDLCDVCSPARLPMVLCRTAKGFEDCTRRFPADLRRALSTFTDRLKPPTGGEDRLHVEGAALGALAIWSLLGEEEHGLDAIRRAVTSDQVMHWIERARPRIRDWLTARGKKVRDGQ